MADESDTDAGSEGFDDWWVLIPLAGLSIPILAVSPWMALGVVAAVVIAAITIAAKILMNHRHKLRLHELGMQQKIAELEASQLEAANRVIEQNAQMRELRTAVATQDGPSGPARSRGVQDA